MLEYVDEAIVLDKEPNGDLDVRVSLFTRRYGKLVAKAKSARKITSKLGSHLEPGNLVSVRLVEKNGLQVADALKKSSVAIRPPDLYHLSRILAEAEQEPELWRAVAGNTFAWPRALTILGWDPGEANCFGCREKVTACFDIGEQQFYCRSCASRRPQNGLLYMYY